MVRRAAKSASETAGVVIGSGGEVARDGVGEALGDSLVLVLAAHHLGQALGDRAAPAAVAASAMPGAGGGYGQPPKARREIAKACADSDGPT